LRKSRINIKLRTILNQSKYAKIIFLEFLIFLKVNKFKIALIELSFESLNIYDLFYTFDNWIIVLTLILRLYKLQFYAI